MIQFAKASSTYAVTTSAFTMPTQGSVSFWVRPTATGVYDYLFNEADEWKVVIDNSNQLIWWLWRKKNEGVTMSGALTNGVLYHLVGTWNNTGNMVVFLNGIQNFDHTGSPTSPGNAVIYFAGQNASGGWANCMLDDFRIYNRRLPLAEAKTIYACGGVDGIREGLIHRWLLNEGAAGVAAAGAGALKDTVGALHATPANSPTYQGSQLRWRRAA